MQACPDDRSGMVRRNTHKKLIGRIIFADLLELSLTKYKDFIDTTGGFLSPLQLGRLKPPLQRGRLKPPLQLNESRGSHLPLQLPFNKLLIKQKKLSKATVAAGFSLRPGVIAEIAKSGRGFSIRYTYEGFNKIYLVDHLFDERIPRSLHTPVWSGDSVFRSLLFRLRRINSRNLLTHKILKGIIEHQREYLKTGDPLDLVPFSQVQLTKWLNGEQRIEHRLCSGVTVRKPVFGKLVRFKGYGNEAHIGNVEGSGSNVTVTELRNGRRNPNRLPVTIHHSWVSRLVNPVRSRTSNGVKGISVITPSGEEKPLKWFFQTQKDINKRLIKQLLDKESEDLQSGKLRKPYTDNEIRLLLGDRLRSFYHRSLITDYRLPILSRWTVGHYRKDMGIPPANRRLSGYKYPPLSANFSVLYPLTIEVVQSNAPASPGVYEFRLKGKEMEYPKGKTNVIYIGRTANIKKRLKEHLGRQSKNHYVRDFLKKDKCLFRYILFKRDWEEEEKRLYRLFLSTFGAPPKCNKVSP